MLCYVMSCNVMLCHHMQLYAIICNAISCIAMYAYIHVFFTIHTHTCIMGMPTLEYLRKPAIKVEESVI